jgi:hypothetical protein
VAGSGTSATSDVAEATVEQIELILLAEIDVERSGTESSQTLCWRERDSNHRSRIKRRASAWPRVSVRADDVSPLAGITHRHVSRSWSCHAEQMVRIRLPPAKSLVRTR